MPKKLDKESFGLLLKMERERLGLTQAATAALLDVSWRGYWKWEHGAGGTLAVTMEGVIERLRNASPVKPT